MDWVTGIQRALDYIEEHLQEEITPQALARAAYTSPYHFQRVFGLLCGHTLGEYVRMRRLTLAGAELAAGKIRVIDAAVKYGYESPDSFARAFQRFHGVKPSQAREPGVRLNSFTRLSVRLTLEGGTQMDYRIEQLPAMTLTGYRRHFEGAPHGQQRERQEETLFTTTRAHQWMLRGAMGSGDDADMAYWGVADRMTEAGYDFWVAVKLNAWERENLHHSAVTGIDFMDRFGFEELIIPGGTYAVFETQREVYPMEAFHRLREQVATQWLPASGYLLRDAPEMEEVHWYRKPNREERYVALWLPVEEKREE